jgi:hypothetical protein
MSSVSSLPCRGGFLFVGSGPQRRHPVTVAAALLSSVHSGCFPMAFVVPCPMSGYFLVLAIIVPAI